MSDRGGLRCPYVSCGSSNAFSFNTDGFGKCHSCGNGYPSNKGKFDWVNEEYPTKGKDYMSEEFTPKKIVVEDKSTGTYKNLRGINSKTMQDYDVKTFDDRQEYIYPSGGIKVRKLPVKGFYAKSGFKGDELFGMNLFTSGCSKMVTITEGELDCLSVSQMLGKRYINPVVSLPSASPAKKLWEKDEDGFGAFAWVNGFDKIILSLDTDKAGNEVADKISKMFPNKVYRVDHSKFKDANEFLMAGKAEEFVSAWWSARKYTPDNVMNSPAQFKSLYSDTPEHTYYNTGIKGLDDKILGLMQGHFTVIKAKTGIGKTEFLRKIEYNLIKQGVPIAAWHLEEVKLRTLLGLVSYECNDNLTRRDLVEEKNAETQVFEAIDTLTKDELFYQYHLSDGQGAEELIEQIRYFAVACGVKFVFFEPIQDVVVGSSEDNKETMLADLAIRLSKLAAELNVGIVTIAHTNEDGAVKYCKMIEQRASVIISLHRDKDAPSIEERNTTFIRIEKNRPTSEEGTAGCVKFNTDTFILTEG
jgi:twinkle protein